MPEPQPSSFGSIHQGMPLRSTNTMPVRQARSDKRGRPPRGFGTGDGRNGSTKSQSLSGWRSIFCCISGDTSPSRYPERLAIYVPHCRWTRTAGEYCELSFGHNSGWTQDMWRPERVGVITRAAAMEDPGAISELEEGIASAGGYGRSPAP